MSRPSFPICVDCKVEYRPKKNGVTVELMAGFGSFELYKADLIECPGCHHQVVSGYGMNPLSVHFWDDYKEVLKKEAKISKMYKCYEKPDLVPGAGSEDGSHKIMVLIEVEDNADYKVIQDNIADFPEAKEVEFPIPVFTPKGGFPVEGNRGYLHQRNKECEERKRGNPDEVEEAEKRLKAKESKK